MNPKITYSILALAFATLACNAVTGQSTATPIPTRSATATVEPTALPVLNDPSVVGVFWDFAYSQDPSQMNKMSGRFPYTHLPFDANILVATLFLEKPQGWPRHKIEIGVEWFQDGIPVDAPQGSLVCASQADCAIITSRRFSPAGLGEGLTEVRTFIGDELLAGVTAEMELVSTEWVGDLYMLQCDSVIAENCNNAGGLLELYTKHAVFPVGTQSVNVFNAYALLAAGTSWQVDLYKDDLLIASETQSVTGAGQWSGPRVSAFSAPAVVFDPGIYYVKLTWNGQVLETVSFEIQ